jgi:preprotein translocase SecE subunit
MATKAAIEKGDQRSAKLQEPGAFQNFSGNAMGTWTGFTSFLSDVRAEMRKVVAPTRKEVQATTSVVIWSQFSCSDFSSSWWTAIFNRALQQVLTRLGGAQ